MVGSMLAEKDRRSLGNGLSLRLLSGLELLQARREAHELAQEVLELPLCSNACLLARALEVDGTKEPLFADGRQVLIGLTAEEIESLARRWDEFRRGSVPGQGETVEVEEGINASFDESRFARKEETV